MDPETQEQLHSLILRVKENRKKRKWLKDTIVAHQSELIQANKEGEELWKRLKQYAPKDDPLIVDLGDGEVAVVDSGKCLFTQLVGKEE